MEKDEICRRIGNLVADRDNLEMVYLAEKKGIDSKIEQLIKQLKDT